MVSTASCLGLLSLLLQGAPAPPAVIHDRALAEYHGIMAGAAEGDMPALVKKLDSLCASFPNAPVVASALETIQWIALLHPGAVPDQPRRWEEMRKAAGANAVLARSIRRVEILRTYFGGNGKPPPPRAALALSDPVVGESWLGLLGRSDAAFRGGDYAGARELALQAVEPEPESPLLASASVLLGLAHAHEGNLPLAAEHFQRAATLTPLETLYGSAQDFLATALRFLPGPTAAPARIFEAPATPVIAGLQEFRDPRSFHFSDGKFRLLDRDQVLVLSPEGKLEEARPARQVEDIAPDGRGALVQITRETVLAQGGRPVRLTAAVGGRTRNVSKLQSVAVGADGDLYLLDEEHGVLRATRKEDDSLAVSVISPARGRLLRMDARGHLYILSQDRKTVSVMTSSGEALISVTPRTAGGKSPSIEHFALDSLNHVYLLDAGAGTIHIVAVNSAGPGLTASAVDTIPLEAGEPFKNLRVLAVSARGELVAAGKGANTWVWYR